MNEKEFIELVRRKEDSSLRNIITYLEEVNNCENTSRHASHLNTVDKLVAITEVQNAMYAAIYGLDEVNRKEQIHTINIIAMDFAHEMCKLELIKNGGKDNEIFCFDISHSEQDEISRIMSMEGVKYIISNPYRFNENWKRNVIPTLCNRLLDKRSTAKSLKICYWFLDPEFMTSLQIVNGVQLRDLHTNTEITGEIILFTSCENARNIKVLSEEAQKNQAWRLEIIVDNLIKVIHNNDIQQIKRNIQLVQYNYGKEEVWEVLESTIGLLQGIKVFDSLNPL